MKNPRIILKAAALLLCFLLLAGAGLLPCAVQAEEDGSQDAYWADSGREALWNALNTGNPKPLSAAERSAFFWQYACYMDLPLEDGGPEGRFIIDENGNFEAEYSYSFDGELSETACSGTFEKVYRLSDWVYALEPGRITWAAQDNEFIVQNVMLFQIPGATDSDAGILKNELRNIAGMEGLSASEPQPFCFITAFDSAPMWYGRVKGSAPRTGIMEESPIGKTMRTVRNKINLRRSASTGSKRITTLKKAGTEVTILGTETDSSGQLWYYVRTSDGKEGYIRGDLLEE